MRGKIIKPDLDALMQGTVLGGLPDMLGFLDMIGNYEQRKVDRYEKNRLVIE